MWKLWLMLPLPRSGAPTPPPKTSSKHFFEARSIQGDEMSTSNTYLTIFLGSKTSPRRAAWDALHEAQRLEKEKEGIASWHAWVDENRSYIVAMGGPLGKSRKVSQ